MSVLRLVLPTVCRSGVTEVLYRVHRSIDAMTFVVNDEESRGPRSGVNRAGRSFYRFVALLRLAFDTCS